MKKESKEIFDFDPDQTPKKIEGISDDVIAHTLRRFLEIQKEAKAESEVHLASEWERGPKVVDFKPQDSE